MKKILSVLIPVYNTEKYIKRCLDSILIKDVLSKIEVIIVSDGSKDNSVNIAKEFQKKYPKTVVLIEKENGGHGSTINKGLEIATGKYFRVVDSDDWLNSVDFVKYVNRLEKDDSDLVVTNYTQEHIYEGKTINYVYSGLKDNQKYNFDKFDLSKLNGEYFVMATSTYKLSVLKESNMKLFEKTFYVDMQYNVVGISKVKTFSYYDLNIYRYFIGRKDQSNNIASMVKNENNHELVIRDLITFYSNNKFSSNKSEYFKKIIYYMLYTHYCIFCVYDTNKHNAYLKIHEFDNWLKEKNYDLYLVSNFDIIKMNRRFNFLPTKINGKLFKKILYFVNKIRSK